MSLPSLMTPSSLSCVPTRLIMILLSFLTLFLSRMQFSSTLVMLSLWGLPRLDSCYLNRLYQTLPSISLSGMILVLPPPLLGKLFIETYGRLLCSASTRTYAGSLWGSLFTGDLARKCNSNAIPHNCLCGHPETLIHLFLHCGAASKIWNLVTDKWTLITNLPSPSPSISTLATAGFDLPSTSLKWHKSLWQILSMTALYAIWTGRCHNVYGDSPSDYVGKFIVNIRRVKKIAIKALPNLRGLQHL